MAEYRKSRKKVEDRLGKKRGTAVHYTSNERTYTIQALDKLRSEVQLAGLGTGLVIRKVTPDMFERITSATASMLTAEEKAIQLILRDSRICSGGVNADFVKHVLRKSPSYRPGNTIYLAFTILPKIRDDEIGKAVFGRSGYTKKKAPPPSKKRVGGIKRKSSKKNKLGYHLAGLVTVGPYTSKDSSEDINTFDDPQINEWAYNYGVRDLDLVCALPNTPPLTASVLLANAIVDDVFSQELQNVEDEAAIVEGHVTKVLPMYTLERSNPVRGISSIDSTALRLGFEFVGLHNSFGLSKPYTRMALRDPMKIAGVFPSTVFHSITNPVKWAEINELCKWDQNCPI